MSVVTESQLTDADEHPPSVAIVEAIAAAEGVAPTELTPLYETVDADAIDRLFAERGGRDAQSMVLRLDLGRWTVVVDDRTVRICEPDRPTNAEPPSETCTGD